MTNLPPSIPTLITRGDHHRSMSARLWLVLVVCLISFTETLLVRHGVMLNTVAITPGVMVAVCYRFGGRRRWGTLLLIGLADLLGAQQGGAPLVEATQLALVHSAEALVAGLALYRLAPDGLDLGRPRSAWALFIVAMVVAPAAGLSMDLLANQLIGQSADQLREATMAPGLRVVIDLVAHWVLPVVLGIVLAAPLALGFLAEDAVEWRNFVTRRRLIDHGVVAGITVAVFFSQGAAYSAFLPAALVWIGVRQGIGDVGAATLASLLIGSIAVALGNGPADVLDSAPQVRQMFLEITYLCCYGWILPVAVALESRERLERDLAQSLESSRQILDNLHEVVFRVDAHAHWTYLNHAWETVTGYSIDATLGRHALELIHPDDLPHMREIVAAFTTRMISTVQLQLRFRRRDGALRDMEIQLRAVEGSDGRFDGALGSLRDITDQSRYMRALQQSEQRFRMLCDASPVGIIRFDRAGAVAYLNSRCELIVMGLQESLIGLSWSHVFGETCASVWQALVEVLITPGAVYEREMEITDHSGLNRWLALSVSGEFDDQNVCMGYIAAITDVTDSRKSAADLAAKTRELRLITENISDVVYRIGIDGRHIYATPSVREVLGHAPGAVIGQRMGERIHPEDRERVMALFQKLAHGELDQVSVAFREYPSDPNKDMLWLEANSRLLRDWNGKPLEIVAALRDVTRSKQLEFDLIEARSRAEAAVRVKSQFLANLSHEIRTPMNGVIGLADLLLGHELDPVSRRYVETIVESGQTMMALLNDILDMAKIEAGRLHVAQETYDLRECLTGTLRLMTASALRKGLDLQQIIAPDVPDRIVGDSLRLRQVLANLVGNAVKFTEQGFVRLTASRQDDRLVITVEDSGIGIAPEQQSHVFDDFVQADATVAGVYGGSGLGLSISRRLTQAMGGDLSLDSELGRGTTLTLSLPIVEPVVAALPAPKAEIALPAPQGAGFRLLVAEDNHTNQIIMQAILQRLGHSVEVAGCGEDVLDKIEEASAAGQPFDGVLMDIQMPGMDGLEATRQLRDRGHDASQLPVIAVTANGYSEDADECRRAGMQGHLVKPVLVATLTRELERALGKRAA